MLTETLFAGQSRAQVHTEMNNIQKPSFQNELLKAEEFTAFHLGHRVVLMMAPLESSSITTGTTTLDWISTKAIVELNRPINRTY